MKVYYYLFLVLDFQETVVQDHLCLMAVETKQCHWTDKSLMRLTSAGLNWAHSDGGVGERAGS